MMRGKAEDDGCASHQVLAFVARLVVYFLLRANLSLPAPLPVSQIIMEHSRTRCDLALLCYVYEFCSSSSPLRVRKFDRCAPCTPSIPHVRILHLLLAPTAFAFTCNKLPFPPQFTIFTTAFNSLGLRIFWSFKRALATVRTLFYNNRPESFKDKITHKKSGVKRR